MEINALIDALPLWGLFYRHPRFRPALGRMWVPIGKIPPQPT
jgi:hypothetical protein